MPRNNTLDPNVEYDIFGKPVKGTPLVWALDANGVKRVFYAAQPHQLPFHAETADNLLALGTRGTGKSTMMRNDAIMRCLLIPGFKALIIRRTMPQLRESHLHDIPREMKALGGKAKGYVWLSTTKTALFPNGSKIIFRHCETEADILGFLSSEYGAIYFDELSTFSLAQFIQISAACRAPEGSGYLPVVRAGSNPLGPGAQWMKQWFVDKNVRLEDYPDYHPDDFVMHFSLLDQNEYVNRADYLKRLKNLPEHVRRAWLLGEFVIEGAYFGEFRPTLRKPDAEEAIDWHTIPEPPTYRGQYIHELPWVSIYRAVDWGFDPDPAVCVWIAVMPNKRAIAFMERKWKKTLAKDVAADIKRLSAGMHIVDTFADPSMFFKDGAAEYSIGDQFEMNGVPMTPGQNKREVYGHAIHTYLKEEIDGLPMLQIVRPIGMHDEDTYTLGCPNLIRTFPMMQMDAADPRKIADGDDHWVVALAQFCMAQVGPSIEPDTHIIPRWQQPKKKKVNVYGRIQ